MTTPTDTNSSSAHINGQLWIHLTPKQVTSHRQFEDNLLRLITVVTATLPAMPGSNDSCANGGLHSGPGHNGDMSEERAKGRQPLTE
ncbi:hypothetical protein RRG08_014469 [Elysia crispata]|uniref:Uncharacterized protein n=1 Tax=Elysia crispata TaxID=231223 RepID=A0AAE0Y5I8_9GAST|nr:hypothetical protein RRG08_014469 [Elysia crispata]